MPSRQIRPTDVNGSWILVQNNSPTPLKVAYLRITNTTASATTYRVCIDYDGSGVMSEENARFWDISVDGTGGSPNVWEELHVELPQYGQILVSSGTALALTFDWGPG